MSSMVKSFPASHATAAFSSVIILLAFFVGMESIVGFTNLAGNSLFLQHQSISFRDVDQNLPALSGRRRGKKAYLSDGRHC